SRSRMVFVSTTDPGSVTALTTDATDPTRTTRASGMDYDVLVAGAGPVGLMLATELRLAGARVLVVERREELDTSVKAGGINTASAEAFDRRGLLPALEAVLRPLF